MSDDVLSSAGLRDVELPPPEMFGPGDWLPWLVLAGSLLLAGWLIWHEWLSPRAVARRRLRQLRRAWRRHELPAREALIRLGFALRLGLRLERLSPRASYPALPPALAARWERFACDFEIARFAPQPCDVSTTECLFDEAHFWLRRWP